MTRAARAILILLVLPLVAIIGQPADATAATRPDTVFSTNSPMPGERFTVIARMGPRVARPVRLQRHTSRGWVTVVRGKTNRQGVARLGWGTFALRTPLRVLAPRTRIRGKRYASRTSVKRVLLQQQQSVRMSAQRDAAGRLDVTVVSSHARRDRGVVLESRRPGASWTPVATGRMPGTTTRSFPGVALSSVPEGAQVRAVLSAYRGAPAVASSVHTAPATDPTFVRLTTQREGDFTRLSAETAGAVTRVRFFVDGVRVGEDQSPPYSISTRLSAGRHEFVARAFGHTTSMLADAEVAMNPSQGVGDTGMGDGFSLEIVQSGFDLPTSAATAGAGLVFISEKAGIVKTITISEDGTWTSPRPVLDLSESVINESDAGLIGVAVDPSFFDNGHIYLSYVLKDPSNTGERQAQQVARYTWNGRELDPASRHIVLGRVTGPACFEQDNLETPDCLPLLGRAHTVGDLAFDDTGNLLVGVGDGSLYASEFGLADRYETMRAQNPEVLAGKLLRIDPVSGRGVPGNPLYKGDGSANSERVLALGLRNPFRFVVDGDSIMIGDVGDASFEEIDRLDLNSVSHQVMNFGWPCLEGEEVTALGDISASDHPFHPCNALRALGTEPPVHTYPHNGGGSVTGGVFLQSDGYPADLRGQYLYGDYAQNHLKSLTLSQDGAPSGVRTIADSSAAMGPVKILTGPDGWVWSVSIYDGSIRRLTYRDESAADHCPVGQFKQSFHDLDGADSAFDRDYPDNEWRWLFPYAEVQLPPETLAEPTCVPEPELASTTGSPWLPVGETDSREHPGDRFGVSWRARVQFEGGTYRFKVRGGEWMRVRLNDELVHDFYTSDFWGDDARAHDVVLPTGQHTIAVEYLHGDQPDAQARLFWERVGGPPSVELVAPSSGWVTDGTIPWQVKVGDPDGDSESDLLARTRVVADFLHYDGEKFHAHPYRQSTGAARGEFVVDDVHAPGQALIRLRAMTTDASGAKTTSAPTYVCFADGDVGPCAD